MKFIDFIHKMMGDPVKFYRRGVKILIPIIYRFKKYDFDNIPEKGPAILICNHVSYMDGLIIDASLKRPCRYIIDKHIFSVGPVKYFLGMYGAIPILPNRQSVEEALEKVSEYLRNGEIVCIFPEGQLTYTGNMSRFRFGVEWILKNDPVPVVPLAVKGLWGSILSRKYRRSKWKAFPRSFRRKIQIKCGKPIDPEEAKISNLQRVIMELKNSIEP